MTAGEKVTNAHPPANLDSSRATHASTTATLHGASPPVTPDQGRALDPASLAAHLSYNRNCFAVAGKWYVGGENVGCHPTKHPPPNPKNILK